MPGPKVAKGTDIGFVLSVRFLNQVEVENVNVPVEAKPVIAQTIDDTPTSDAAPFVTVLIVLKVEPENVTPAGRVTHAPLDPTVNTMVFSMPTMVGAGRRAKIGCVEARMLLIPPPVRVVVLCAATLPIDWAEPGP